jgi:hypothetical protein
MRGEGAIGNYNIDTKYGRYHEYGNGTDESSMLDEVWHLLVKNSAAPDLPKILNSTEGALLRHTDAGLLFFSVLLVVYFMSRAS